MVGIIVAVKEELESIKILMKNIKEENRCGSSFYVGTINEKECVLSLCGVGKVNSARITQILIDYYNPEYIINSGVAGGINNRVNIFDIVIGEKLVQHDFDLTAFGREKGEVSDEVAKFIFSDPSLVRKAQEIIDSNNSINGIVGTIASGDIFVTDTAMSKKINSKFNADCCEMEGAAIAQTCFLDKTPFLVIRSISDIPNNDNKIDYDKFIKEAANTVADFVSQLIK